MTSAVPFRTKKEASSVPAKKAASKTPTKKMAAPTVAEKTKKSPVKKDAVAVKAAPEINSKDIVSIEQRYRMICEAAFYLAEKNGFNPDMSLENWLQAEKEIDAKIFN